MRQWFNREPEKWPEFQKHYIKELKNHHAAIHQILQKAKKQIVTFVCASKEVGHNNAATLCHILKSL